VATVERLKNDLREFQKQAVVDQVVVVNLASTEPANDSLKLPERWDELAKCVDGKSPCSLPASSLYAIAALDLGLPYINFTPSLGSSPEAVLDLAVQRGACHAGQDGKTGETLLKSVLAPMFAARTLEVMSWVGHNIFGNLDGLVLDDPANKAAKVKNKDQLVGSILGYEPQSLVSIEYIRSLGDWKTAWDHIHFRGFLGTPMSLQLTWQGCDSLLAAPLVLDLVRFVELSQRQGETGLLSHLGSFFKRPLGLKEHDFSRQFSLLCEWAERHSS
jgi:myo-inositol-1-phosphate synthase